MNEITEKELMLLLESAKKAGAKRIEMLGFCLVFEVKKSAVLEDPMIGKPAPENFDFPVRQSKEKSSERQDDKTCRDCGSTDMRKSNYGTGNYCHDCYLDKQELRK